MAAYLRRQDEGWFDWLQRTAGRDGLAHFFDELDDQARETDYRGCPFRMALAEYPSRKSEVYRIAVENKLRTRDRFRELAADAGASDPGTVADQLVLLMDGVCASAAERNPGSQPGAGPKLVRDLLSAGVSPDLNDRRPQEGLLKAAAFRVVPSVSAPRVRRPHGTRRRSGWGFARATACATSGRVRSAA